MKLVIRAALAIATTGLLTACGDNASSPMDPTAAAPSLAITVNPNGTGFVGKGDVQFTFGWANKALQDNARSVQFRTVRAEEAISEWTCVKTTIQYDRDGNVKDVKEITQERNRTVTSTITTLLSSEARLRNQFTGFNLLGVSGIPVVTSTKNGPALGTCPANPSGFVLEGDVTTIVTTLPNSGNEVSATGKPWTALLPAPVVIQ